MKSNSILKKLWILGYPKGAQWRFWSDCANAQSDLNLRWAHMSTGTFSNVPTHIHITKYITCLTLNNSAKCKCTMETVGTKSCQHFFFLGRLTLWANSADDRFVTFFLVFPENRLCHFMQIVCLWDILCQWLFSWQNKKNISKCHLQIFYATY